MTYLIEQVRARCARAGLPLAVPGEYTASRPLEIVQIDHTEVDLFLVDEEPVYR